MLRIRDFRVKKAGRTICHVPEFEVQRGERVAVVGANGSGKTTLLRVLGGLERDFNGQCQFETPPRNRVFLHQSPYLFRGSVLSNAAYGLRARSVPRRERMSKAHKWLSVLGVEHLAERQCDGLSGGEQRRVALARTFATDAEVLLLDEPFSDLDQEGVDTVCNVLSTMTETTIFIASPTALSGSLTARSLCVVRQ